MAKKSGVVVLIVLLLSVSLVAFPEEAEKENLSAGRNLGVGMQIGFPWGGLVSGRYWITPRIGLEGILFAWGSTSDFTGTFTGRGLYRITDTPTVDFYVASGASLPFSSYGEHELFLSVVGGIEFNFPFARSLAWNLEFGGSFSPGGELGMAFGTGIHFYF